MPRPQRAARARQKPPLPRRLSTSRHNDTSAALIGQRTPVPGYDHKSQGTPASLTSRIGFHRYMVRGSPIYLIYLNLTVSYITKEHPDPGASTLSSIYHTQHSTAQHSKAQSAVHKAAKHVRARQSAMTQASRQCWREPVLSYCLE